MSDREPPWVPSKAEMVDGLQSLMACVHEDNGSNVCVKCGCGLYDEEHQDGVVTWKMPIDKMVAQMLRVYDRDELQREIEVQTTDSMWTCWVYDAPDRYSMTVFSQVGLQPPKYIAMTDENGMNVIYFYRGSVR